MTTRQSSASPNDRLFSYVFSGALGSAAIALLFLLIDGLRGDPFFTPSFMGSVLLLGTVASSVMAWFIHSSLGQESLSAVPSISRSS